MNERAKELKENIALGEKLAKELQDKMDAINEVRMKLIKTNALLSEELNQIEKEESP